MFANIQTKMIFIVAIASLAPLVSAIIQPTHLSFAQTNGTQTNATDYTKFHTNIEIIVGHIEKAIYNKNMNNDSFLPNHTSHPINEVLSVITIPLTNADKTMNKTYFDDLYALSGLVVIPNNTTKEEFNKHAQRLIDLSNKVISLVVPAKILNDTLIII